MGWTWASFDDVATVESNLVSPAEFLDRPHIAPNHIEGGTTRLLPFTTVKDDGVTSPKHLFQPGHILYSKIRPYLRKAALATFEGLCSADMYPVATSLEPRYLLWWLISPEFTSYAIGQQGRSVLPKINREALSKLPIPVPPLAEQDRIVAAIEEHFSHLDVGVESLQRAERNLDRLRSLTFSSLLADRAWPWTTLGEIAEIVGGVTKDTKRQGDPAFVEVPYLRVANVQRGYLDLREVTTIRVPPEKAKALELLPGDILFNEGGDRDKLGRGWVWEGQIEHCIHQNHVFRARLIDEGFHPRFISMHGNTFGQGWFERMGKQTTNLASISLKTLKAFPIPAPSYEEQERVVQAIERRLTVFASTEATIRSGLHRAESLRRAVLTKAFTGGLVRQDPSEEPAAILLERIAETRYSVPKRRTRRSNA